ncbi:KaiC/GvpD/RAD55 family RecA-like ATPase [Bradyrhizobium sp. S3.3.6]|uniref:hypothetical protein n=1 Tax=Bradyrhizobium sp. S3.3.6 TaxID=3156429 RepID=UPI0033914219
MRHLIDTPTHSYDGSRASFIDARTIDDIVDPIELFAPLSADSSQIAAVVAAQRGAGYVLFGPPGRGKSQTIANTITNGLAHEKTVLLVAATVSFDIALMTWLCLYGRFGARWVTNSVRVVIEVRSSVDTG